MKTKLLVATFFLCCGFSFSQSIYDVDYKDFKKSDSFRSSLDVSRGKYPGLTVVHKFGRNEAVGTTIEPITLGGTYQTPSVLTSLEVLSSSADDTAAGSGARTVVVNGLSTGWREIEETVTLNGTTPVALTNQFYRIFRVRLATSGTYATQTSPSHAGTITVRTAGAGATWAVVNDTTIFAKGQSQIGAYTVPAGYTAYVKSIWIHVESSKPANVFFFQRQGADVASPPYTPMRLVQEWDGIDGAEFFNVDTPLGPFPEKTDLGFMGRVSSTSAAISIDFEILLVKNL